MKYFTKKQLEQLSQYEEHFRTVVKALYKRATPARVNDMVADIYEQTTGEVLQRNWSCAHCGFTIFKKCGELYYASLEHYKVEDAKVKEEQKIVKEEQNEKEKPVRSSKVGRPKSTKSAKSTKSNTSANETRKKKDIG